MAVSYSTKRTPCNFVPSFVQFNVPVTWGHLIIAPTSKSNNCLIEMTKYAHKPTNCVCRQSIITWAIVCARGETTAFFWLHTRTHAPGGTQIRPPVTAQPPRVASANVWQIATCHRPINLSGQFSFQLIKLWRWRVDGDPKRKFLKWNSLTTLTVECALI
jgi:hypothetical protein